MTSDNLRYRFHVAQQQFARLANVSSKADAALWMWAESRDSHLPRPFMQLSLREVLSKPFDSFEETRGIGDTKLNRFVSIVERAVKDLSEDKDGREAAPLGSAANGDHRVGGAGQASSGHQTDVKLLPTELRSIEDSSTDGEVQLDDLDGARWDEITRSIRRHHLQCYPVGRFAQSLCDLPHGFWSEPLDRFLDTPHRELTGQGTRIREVAKILVHLGQFLRQVPCDGTFKLNVSTSAIRDLAAWVERVVDTRILPSLEDLSTNFLEPIERQLAIDLQDRYLDVTLRRMHVDVEHNTLEEIAQDYELSRERIRQIASRAKEVMHVRWPEGKYLLNDFCDVLQDATAAESQKAVINRAIEVLFGTKAIDGVSMESVLKAWHAAGREKRTPMSENEVIYWLAQAFPSLPPTVGMEWIRRNARTFDNDGWLLFFSDYEVDSILLDLYSRSSPAELEDFVEDQASDARSLRARLKRDLRFVFDDYDRVSVRERHGFIRATDQWHVELADAPSPVRNNRSTIELDTLALIITSGLMQSGIVDATVWGVHRFANEVLCRMFGAPLSEAITPFVLADALVSQSGGLIRPMRRRRLRWDQPDSEIPARGKRGWIGHAVADAGIPVTLGEVGELLQRFYQDYAQYALAQLDLDTDEEGEYHCSATLIPGVPHRVPPLLVPAGWQFDRQAENVSEEIKLLAAKIIVMAREGDITLGDISYLPWLVELVEQHAYGESIWNQRDATQERSAANVTPTPLKQSDASSPPVRQQRPVNPTNVDDLLAKFL